MHRLAKSKEQRAKNKEQITNRKSKYSKQTKINSIITNNF